MNLRVRLGLAIAVAALAVVAAALLATSQRAPASGATATASRTASVEMVNFDFRPGTRKIDKGTKIVFSNTSSRPHTATRRGTFDTGRVKPGRSASITFSRRGTFGYFCKIHPEMRGRVVVD